MTHDGSDALKALTDLQIVDSMTHDTPFARARRAFSYATAAIEQAAAQRVRPTPVETRRLEYAAVERIAEALGVTVDVRTGRTAPAGPARSELRELIERADDHMRTVTNRGDCGPHHLISDMAAALRRVLEAHGAGPAEER